MEQQNETPEKKSRRGGRRPGAGRPNVKNVVGTITLRIPQDIADILAAQEHRTDFILAAIRAYAARTDM